ncbi:MAG: 2-hydroxyacid dehydrogenase [Betaproteobacteria bacterium]
MKIVVCASGPAAARYAAALAAHLPAADIFCRDACLTEADPTATPADYAVVWRPPPALFEEQRRLRAVFNLGAGVDALLALPNLPPELPLVRLEDAGMAGDLAEYVLAAVLRVYRGFDRYAAQQARGQWQPRACPPRARYAVGVLGLGAIGGAIARTLAAHGFAVRGFARSRHEVPGVHCFAGVAESLRGNRRERPEAVPSSAPVQGGTASSAGAASGRAADLHASSEFGAFLDGLDALVSVLPLTADNRGILNRAALERLADGAHLVNVGRGAHVVEDDLLALLDAGKLGAATLDVFAVEPLPPAHPFWRHPSILVTPHVSAETQIEDAAAQIAAKLARLARGEAVGGVVDRQRGY